MPITPLLTMEAANLFAGTSTPNNLTDSNHLRLTDVKLPGLDEQYVDLRAAGAPVAVEVDTVINRLECTFTLAGWNAYVSELVDGWGAELNQFWVYGALRDRVSGNVYQAEGKIYGRLARADPQLWRRGDLHHWAYSIRCITRYKLTIENETPIYEWDYFASRFLVGGFDRMAVVNAALHIAA